MASRASALFLLVGALASAAALANCSAAEESAGDEVLSEDEINGANNKMGLRLVYDEASGTIRATVKDKLHADERLHLRVRRGRLSIDSQRSVRCDDLPEAPALPIAEGQDTVVYQGPRVEPWLLVSVYDENWIRGAITPQMLDELARDGADSIVEACIVRGRSVRARLQTSVAYAWDENDPNANAAIRPQGGELGDLGGTIGLLARDGGASDGGGSSRPREGAPIQSMEKYAELCVAELGEIPFFKKIAKGKYDTFDCRDFVGSDGKPIEGVEGALVPQTVTDGNDRDVTPAECDDKNSRRYNCFKTCDKPEWLFQSCEPGPTVTTAKNDKGTHWTLLCRSAGKRDGDEKTADLLKTKVFNDIAMIGHNPVTGKTCFFQNKIFDGTDGSRVTHPADVEKSRHIWDGPKGYCMNCHSAEAFIHSPWIDGAKRADGTPIVPMMGKHPDFEISWNASPFSVVNREAQGQAFVGGGNWRLPKQLVSEGADACTTCHRLGGGDGLRRFAAWATGEEGLDREPRGTSGPLQPKLSPWGKKFENSHWMPLRLDGLNEDNWASSRYGKAMAHIKACAANENASGCEWADVPAK